MSIAKNPRAHARGSPIDSVRFSQARGSPINRPDPIFSGAEGYGRLALGTAFQTLMSSKNPSLPATPNSIFDLVACAMPDDFK